MEDERAAQDAQPNLTSPRLHTYGCRSGSLRALVPRTTARASCTTSLRIDGARLKLSRRTSLTSQAQLDLVTRDVSATPLFVSASRAR